MFLDLTINYNNQLTEYHKKEVLTVLECKIICSLAFENVLSELKESICITLE